MDERLKLDCENPFRIGNWVTDIFGHVMQIRSLRGPYAAGRYIDEDGTLHEAEGHVDRGIGCIELEPRKTSTVTGSSSFTKTATLTRRPSK